MSRKAKRDHSNNPFESGEFVLDLKQLAIFSIKTYFADKFYFCGGPIPEKELLSKKAIRLVLRSQNDDPTFEYIHNECLARLERPARLRSCTVHWRVKFLLELIADMKQRHLPKDFQPGLILLYFKFCKGYQICDSLLSIKK